MSPQSLYLCGFLEARVEMKIAPFRALIHTWNANSRISSCLSRNEDCPFQGIDTLIHRPPPYLCGTVEMKIAPIRALTQYHFHQNNQHNIVEMKVAPFRALTLVIVSSLTLLC